MKAAVTAFFDEATNTVSYIVADPATAKAAIVDCLAPAHPRAPTRSSRNSYFRPTPSAAHARADNGPLQVLKIRPAAPWVI
jgi:hypothetical protein